MADDVAHASAPVAIVPAEHAGRADYDQLVNFRGLEPGEPYFMVRAKDAVAGDTVRAWVMLASIAGAPPALLEQALRHADRLDEWPVKKVPDAGHLTEAEQKDLVYCLQRRAWSAREDALDLRIFLAERRAHDQAVTELRPLRRALETAIDDACAQFLKDATTALAEAKVAMGDGDRDAAQRAYGRCEGLQKAYDALIAAGSAG
jgi:hypothetical protein